jgi:small conductance mechanosensitive channel
MLFLLQVAEGVKDTLKNAAKSVEKGFNERFEDAVGFSFDDAKHKLVHIATNLVIAIVIIIVGWWLAKTAGKAIKKVLTKSKTDAGLITFLTSLVVISLKILVLLTAITQLGVQMTSFITILGAAGLAIGMAFSGTLANFAGGVMILFFKPFKVGDTILALTHEGKVTEIQIFYTYLNTGDNKVVILPNGPLANGNLVNFTKEKKRRAEWSFVLDPEVDYLKAHETLQKLIKADKRVLPKPEPTVVLNGLQHGAPHVLVRAWVSTDAVSNVHADYNKAVYDAFKEMNITFFKEL